MSATRRASAGDANWIHATGPAPTASNRLPLIDFGWALATVLNDEPNEATDEKKHEPQKEHRPPVKRRREINALPLASGNGPATHRALGYQRGGREERCQKRQRPEEERS